MEVTRLYLESRMPPGEPPHSSLGWRRHRALVALWLVGRDVRALGLPLELLLALLLLVQLLLPLLITVVALGQTRLPGGVVDIVRDGEAPAGRPRVCTKVVGWLTTRLNRSVARPHRRFDEQLVHVAPAPVLARLEAPHESVVGRMEMLGGMLALRVVAAADVAALLAQPEVDPAHAGGETFLATVGRVPRGREPRAAAPRWIHCRPT